MHTVQIPPAVDPTPPRRRGRWGLAAVALLALGFLALFVANIRLPYLATSPGPVVDVHEIITVEGAEQFDHNGQLYFLTIQRPSTNLTLLELVEAWRDPSIDVVERRLVIPEGQTSEERRRENLESMLNSQQIAVAVALERLGYEIDIVGLGAEVRELVEGGAADGVLEPGDVIVAVEQIEVEFVSELVAAVRSFEIGDTVLLTVERAGETQELKVTLGESESEPGAPIIGVLVADVGAHFEFPIDVDIDSGAIGGPSAGMMLTLGVYNQLSEEDITRGRRIAGTGTISSDGTVGPIGGIKQKVFAAIGVGAEYILVPANDFDIAVDAADGRIEVVAVGTIDEALAFLDALPAI
jgi:PDZ domain-containing protein